MARVGLWLHFVGGRCGIAVDAVVPLWCRWRCGAWRCGAAVVALWCLCGAAVGGAARCSLGVAVVLLWWRCGGAVVALWCCCGAAAHS